MNVWTCQCGKSKYYESGLPPKSCQGCDECGTAYGLGKVEFKQLEPHVSTPVHDRYTGAVIGYECKVCHETLVELP